MNINALFEEMMIMLEFRKIWLWFLLVVLITSDGARVAAEFSTANTKQTLIARNKSSVFWGSTETELISAISSKNFERAKSMILNDEQIFLLDSKKRSALHYAARIGNLELVRLLVEKGANVNEKDIFSQTPLMLSISEEISDFLIANGTNVEFAEANRRVRNFDPLLKIAVANDSIEEAKDLLEHGANVNILDKLARTPLFFCRSVEMVKLLISHGADIHMLDSSYTSIFEVFATSGDVKLLAYLIEVSGGQNSLSFLNFWAMTYQAIKIDNVKMFKFIVDDVAKLIWQNSKYAVDMLCNAIEHNSQSIVDFILSKDIDVNMRNSNKVFPLDVATDAGNFESVKKLIAKGASIKPQNMDKVFL